MKLISIGKNLTAGVETVIYTVPEGYQATWNMMYIHNGGGNTKSLTVEWQQTVLAVDIAILDARTFASKEYFQFNGYGSGVVLRERDQIKMTPEASSAFSVICTVALEKAQA
ncbi:MAG: hypothetical protein ACOVLB_08165 [Candidatus Nanopelagicus sp.]